MNRIQRPQRPYFGTSVRDRWFHINLYIFSRLVIHVKRYLLNRLETFKKKKISDKVKLERVTVYILKIFTFYRPSNTKSEF